MTPQLLATGPANPSPQLGDRILLGIGLELTLIYCEDMISIYRTSAPSGVEEMWTEYLERPGLYIRVCEWPQRSGEVFDRDEAIDLALIEQITARNFFDLESLAPFDIRRALSREEMA